MSTDDLPSYTTRLLSDEQILSAYDSVAALYPHIPSLSMWRAWEYAAYRSYTIETPVLDVGCGDGRWFRLVWPEVHDVCGVDMEPGVIQHAIASGVYRRVWQADAAALPEAATGFATVFANCSLEHMDDIGRVMANIYRALRPGGQFIFSIVTDRLPDWFSPADLARAWGDPQLAGRLYDDWLGYHHLVNPFPIERWQAALAEVGFELVEHVPIISEMTARLFFLLDSLWHTRRESGELGDWLHPYIERVPNFPTAFRGVLQSVLLMEQDRSQGCGAVLMARKK